MEKSGAKIVAPSIIAILLLPFLAYLPARALPLDAASNLEPLDKVEDLAKGTLEAPVSLQEELPLDGVLNIIPNPILTEKEEGEIIGSALNLLGLKEWSSDGWEFAGMDFIGTAGPDVNWEKAIVHLHLPDGSGDPPVECSQGWSATIDISLDTHKVQDAGFPTESSHDCASAIVLGDPDVKSEKQEGLLPLFSMPFIQTAEAASARPSYIIAEADDVTSHDIHGAIASLNAPSYDSGIFDDMDSYVALLLNQKWSTSPVQHMVQIGWLMTAVEGCVDCGSEYIAMNSATLVFTDSSIFGDLEAHRIPFAWQDDEELIAGTMCNEDEKYLIWLQYDDDKIFNHNTNIPCEKPDNDSKVSNSVFFENWNTVDSSSWADDITGKVRAYSAYSFKDEKDLQNWQVSTNEGQECTGARKQTSIISGNLADGNAATWSELSNIPAAC